MSILVVITNGGQFRTPRDIRFNLSVFFRFVVVVVVCFVVCSFCCLFVLLFVCLGFLFCLVFVLFSIASTLWGCLERFVRKQK